MSELSAIELEAERTRFNALSQDDAKKLAARMEGLLPACRSCWYCNAGHEHLKEADYPINCAWGCGVWYLRGYPAQMVMARAEGNEITEDDMRQFNEVLAEAM